MSAASPNVYAFPQPTAGDVVLCRFPQNLLKPAPAPKARPAIVLSVYAPLPGEACYRVRVCYGTKNLSRIYPHDCEVTKAQHSAEYHSAGLSYDTKFDMHQALLLPYTSEWFLVPHRPRFGMTPKIGVMHPATVPRLSRAKRNVQGAAP
jgi:hypothetical protein